MCRMHLRSFAGKHTHTDTHTASTFLPPCLSSKAQPPLPQPHPTNSFLEAAQVNPPNGPCCQPCSGGCCKLRAGSCCSYFDQECHYSVRRTVNVVSSAATLLTYICLSPGTGGVCCSSPKQVSNRGLLQWCMMLKRRHIYNHTKHIY